MDVKIMHFMQIRTKALLCKTPPQMKQKHIQTKSVTFTDSLNYHKKMKQDDLNVRLCINRQLKNIFKYYLNFVQTTKIAEQSMYTPTPFEYIAGGRIDLFLISMDFNKKKMFLRC